MRSVIILCHHTRGFLWNRSFLPFKFLYKFSMYTHTCFTCKIYDSVKLCIRMVLVLRVYSQCPPHFIPQSEVDCLVILERR